MLFATNYHRSLFFAVILHVIIISLLFVHYQLPMSSYSMHKHVRIIKAFAINEAQFTKTIAATKLVEKKALEQQQQRKLQKERRIARHKQLVHERMLRAKRKHEEELKLKAEHARKLRLEREHARKLELAKKAQEKKLKLAMAQEIAAEQKQMVNQQARAMQTLVDKYKAAIVQAISARWIVPKHLANDVSCQILVNLAPGGVVLAVTIVKSSGNPALDHSALNAVYKASPLPVPKNPRVFDNFRQLRLTVHPEGTMD